MGTFREKDVITACRSSWNKFTHTSGAPRGQKDKRSFSQVNSPGMLVFFEPMTAHMKFFSHAFVPAIYEIAPNSLRGNNSAYNQINKMPFDWDKCWKERQKAQKNDKKS